MSQPLEIRREILLTAAEALAPRPNFRAGRSTSYDAGYEAGVQAMRQALRDLAAEQQKQSRREAQPLTDHEPFCGCDCCWDRREHEQLEVDPGLAVRS